MVHDSVFGVTWSGSTVKPAALSLRVYQCGGHVWTNSIVVTQ